jgi:hypothetical protein
MYLGGKERLTEVRGEIVKDLIDDASAVADPTGKKQA